MKKKMKRREQGLHGMERTKGRPFYSSQCIRMRTQIPILPKDIRNPKVALNLPSPPPVESSMRDGLGVIEKSTRHSHIIGVSIHDAISIICRMHISEISHTSFQFESSGIHVMSSFGATFWKCL